MANSAIATTRARDISAKVVTKGISTTITVVETDRIRDRVETAMAATFNSHNSNLKPNRYPLMPVWPLNSNNKCNSRCRRSLLILKPRCFNSNNSNR